MESPPLQGGSLSSVVADEGGTMGAVLASTEESQHQHHLPQGVHVTRRRMPAERQRRPRQGGAPRHGLGLGLMRGGASWLLGMLELSTS